MDNLQDDSPVGYQLKSLKELVTSDGWRLFEEMIDADWGAEQVLRKTEQALEGLSGNVDQATVNDTVQQIHAARRAVQQVRRLPHDAMARLSADKPSKRPFEALRRIGR